jgi:hypothetical protein
MATEKLLEYIYFTEILHLDSPNIILGADKVIVGK